MPAQVFTSLILGLTVIFLMANNVFYKHFNTDVHLQNKIAKLEKQIDKTQFERNLDEIKFQEFRRYVALLVPEVLNNLKLDSEESFPLRNLASVAGHKESEQLRIQASRLSFDRANKLFLAKDYKKAIGQFGQFVEKYPFSENVVKAYFLMAEASFKVGDFDGCLATVEKMVNLFPDSEMTGFALLRSGKIYQIRQRPEEAAEIYETVLRSFPFRQLASEARSSLGSVEL